MILTLFVADDCPACARAEKKIREVVSEKDDIKFVVKDLKEDKPQIVFIVPALFINEKLFLYGEVDKERLSNKINSLL